MMRVITGLAKGRRLASLPGEDITRPTTESLKEAMFSMVQFELEGKKVLDLFAGSGQLGIEALSRGARLCTFVENSRPAMTIVRQNIDHCGFSDESQVVFCEATSFLSRRDNFDIAILDPPYGKGLIEKCMPKLINMMSPDGIIICECSKEETLPDSFDSWHIDRQRRHGKSQLVLYRHS